MKIKADKAIRATLLVSLMLSVSVLSTRLQADTGTCGGASITLPFTDVAPGNVFFCSIAEAFFSGLSNGTSATTYGPSANVTREQMAALVTRTMDQSLKRGSKRAALNQNWTTQSDGNLGLTGVGGAPTRIQSDGADVWVASGDNTVSRVRASDGKLLETWSVPNAGGGVLCAMGKVFVAGIFSPGTLYQIDPTQAPGAVTTVADTLGDNPFNIAYDGQRIWTANMAGSVSIITLNPVSVTTASTGFTALTGIIFDGTNMWVSDANGSAGKLHKLDSNGAIVLSVDFGNSPQRPAFDGTNIWVPRFTANAVTVVRATGSLSGTVLATLTGNGLSQPRQAAFDGQRILVTNPNTDSVSLWNSSDLSPIGTFSTGAGTFPQGACSDGLNFWVTLQLANKVARF